MLHGVAGLLETTPTDPFMFTQSNWLKKGFSNFLRSPPNDDTPCEGPCHKIKRQLKIAVTGKKYKHAIVKTTWY